VVLNLKQRIVELRLPSSEDSMSLLMSFVPALPVVAHAEASPDLASIPWFMSFRMSSLQMYLGYHQIGMWSFPLSWNLVLLLFRSVLIAWLQRNWLR
jgi:hypothetical protein